MSSMTWPDHLLSLDEWDELPEDVSRKFELVEGMLQMSPRPAAEHQHVIMSLGGQLNAQLGPDGLVAVPEVDVVLVEAFPPLLRAPDLVITSLEVVRKRPKRLSAADVHVAIEVVSPGSARIDRIAKLADYAEAGIEHYWIIDLEGEVTLDTFRLVAGRYEPVVSSGTDEVTLEAPRPVTIDLAALLP